MRAYAVAAAYAFFPCWLFAAETDGRIIVSRQDDAVEIYLSISGGELSGFFGVDTAFLSASNGHVDMSQFQQDTAAWGDQLMNDVLVHLDGKAVTAEAISLMLHDRQAVIPFDTPWSALTAVALCKVVADYASSVLEDTNAYVGYSIYPADGLANVQLILPLTGRADMAFAIKTYLNGNLISEEVSVLADGQLLTFAAVTDQPPTSNTHYFRVIALLLAGTVGAIVMHASLRNK